MKHLGVKTRAVDSKKSRGGFFRRQLVKVGLTPIQPFCGVAFLFLHPLDLMALHFLLLSYCFLSFGGCVIIPE